MKSCMRALGALVLLLGVPRTFAQKSPPEIPFESVPDFFKLPPGMNFGEVPGVAVNSKGHIFVFTRSNSANGPAYAPAAAQLFEFGPHGEFLREIGKGLYAWSEAHSVRIDRDDNIWAIDKGSDMIIKFNPAGRVVWVFGRRKEGADEDAKPWEHPEPPLAAIDGLFRQPTDVTWDSQGNIYISDGYVNSRIAKYDKNGDWVKSWGEKGTATGQFRLPHAIVADQNNNLYVADRTNRRIQVFDTDGKFLRTFTIDVASDPRTRAVNGNTPTGDRLAAVSGAPNSMCITPGPKQVLFVGESTFPGRLFKVSLDGKVLGVIGKSGRQLGQFSGIHQLACPSENEVYAAETSNWRVQKLILHPQAQGAGTGR
jgi:DNA-binding beta-propeller fold protein YncE